MSSVNSRFIRRRETSKHSRSIRQRSARLCRCVRRSSTKQQPLRYAANTCARLTRCRNCHDERANEGVQGYLDKALQTTDLSCKNCRSGGNRVMPCENKIQKKQILLCRDAAGRSARSGLHTIGETGRMGPEANDRIISPRLLPTDRAENPRKNQGIDEYRSVGLEIK